MNNMSFDSNFISYALQELFRSNFILAGAVFLLATLLLWEIWSWNRLRHVPGPFFHSVSVLPMVRMAATGKLCFLQRRVLAISTVSTEFSACQQTRG